MTRPSVVRLASNTHRSVIIVKSFVPCRIIRLMHSASPTVAAASSFEKRAAVTASVNDIDRSNTYLQSLHCCISPLHLLLLHDIQQNIAAVIDTLFNNREWALLMPITQHWFNISIFTEFIFIVLLGFVEYFWTDIGKLRT